MNLGHMPAQASLKKITQLTLTLNSIKNYLSLEVAVTVSAEPEAPPAEHLIRIDAETLGHLVGIVHVRLGHQLVIGHGCIER